MRPDPKHLTPAEAAARLGVHPRTLVRWTHAGRLSPYVTPGGHRRYPTEQLETIVQERDE